MARIGNAQATVDVPRIMNRAATCNERSYASPPTPPFAHFDRLTGDVYCFSIDCSTINCCFEVKYSLSLLDEISIETQRTEKSHNAQSLMLWDDG